MTVAVANTRAQGGRPVWKHGSSSGHSTDSIYEPIKRPVHCSRGCDWSTCQHDIESWNYKALNHTLMSRLLHLEMKKEMNYIYWYFTRHSGHLVLPESVCDLPYVCSPTPRTRITKAANHASSMLSEWNICDHFIENVTKILKNAIRLLF